MKDCFLFIFLLFIVIGKTNAQLLDFTNKQIVTIDNPAGGDAIQIELYGKYQKDGQSKKYYYFPNSSMFKLGTKSNGIQNFTFTQYTSDGSKNAHDLTCPEDQGALLHTGITFGMTNEQMNNLQHKLQQQVPGASIAGMVPIRPAKARNIYELNSDKDSTYDASEIEAKIAHIESNPIQINATLIPSGHQESKIYINGNGAPPTRPGDAGIVSANLNPSNAVTMADAFTTGNSLISTTFYYEFDLIAPISKATVKIDWSKFENNYERNESEYRTWVKRRHKLSFKKFNPFKALKKVVTGRIGDVKGMTINTNERTGFTQKEIRTVYEFLREKEIITLDYLETGAELGSFQEEEIKAIREKIFDHFWTKFSKNYTTNKPPQNVSTEDSKSPSNESSTSNKIKGNVYYFRKVDSQNSTSNTKIQKEESVDIKLAVTFTKALTYTIAIKSNGVSRKGESGTRSYPTIINNNVCEKCVRIVNLCDVEYQRREVTFVLDQNLIYLMKNSDGPSYINSVSMQVRNGNNYYDEFVITPNDISDLNRCSFSYARNGEPNMDKFLAYEYRGIISFSSKTGYPDYSIGKKNGDWQVANGTALQLKPPHDFEIRPNKTVSLAGNRTTLREMGIYTVQAIIEHELLGKKRKQSLIFKTTSGDGFADEVIAIDKTSSDGFKYILIYQTTEGEKFSTSPQEGIWGEGIIIKNNIPPEAKENDDTLKEILPKLEQIALDWLRDVIN